MSMGGRKRNKENFNLSNCLIFCRDGCSSHRTVRFTTMVSSQCFATVDPRLTESYVIKRKYWGEGEPNQAFGSRADRISLFRGLKPPYSWNDEAHHKNFARYPYKALCYCSNCGKQSS